MLSKDEKKEHISQLKKLRKDIVGIRRELNKINDIKEKFFKEKQDLSKKISDEVSKIRSLKSRSDNVTKEVHDFKAERDKYNQEVRSIINVLKKLNEEKKAFLKQHNIKTDPSKLKDTIEKLELKIETEAPSFNEEKKIMDQIKRLKKSYQEVAAVSVVLEKIKKEEEKLKKAKEKAEGAHQKVIGLSREGGFEDFIELSKEINDMRKARDEKNAKFKEEKAKVAEINNKLKEKLMEMQGLQSKLEADKNATKIKKKEAEENFLKEKVKDVEEKLKTKKKLTTEDLLIFQRDNGNN